MPIGNFDSEHLYVQWGGKLPGSEQWSCGLRMAKKTAGTVDAGGALLTGVAAAVQTMHTNAYAYIAGNAKLSFVKVNAITVGGTYRELSGTTQALYADVAGGGGTQMHPNQIALAVTLATGFSRGPANKGRYYLPLPNLAVASDGLVASAEIDNVEDIMTAFLTNLNAVNADYEVAVFSRRSPGAAHRKVTDVKIGRVLDTQRRRRRALIEDYRT